MGKRAAINTNRLTVACDDKMAQKVYDLADRYDVSVSQVLRDLLAKGLSNAPRR